MNLKIVAFDPASYRNLGWAVTKLNVSDSSVDAECTAGTFVLKDVEEPWMSLWPFFVLVDELISTVKPDLVIMEGTSSFSGSFITGQVANCIGVIYAACGKNEMDVDIVHPTHVKKVVTGKGRATKTIMKNSVISIVKELTGEEKIKYDSHHAYDAMGNILTYLKDKNYV